MPKKSAPQFQRSAFVSRRECASQLQQTPDRPDRSVFPCRQSRPRQPRPSSCPRRRNTCSRSTGNGSLQIVGRRTLSDAAKTEHFAVTRPELLLVHRRCLARARTRSSFTPVHVLSATLNIRLSSYVCVRLRFCLRFG